MALFRRLKQIFSDTNKENSGHMADQVEKDLAPDISDTTVPQADEPEPEAGSEAYLLYALNQNNAAFPEDLALVRESVPAALKAVKDRLDLKACYARWKEQELKAEENPAYEERQDSGEKAGCQENQDHSREPGPAKVKTAMTSADAEIKVFFSRNRMAGFVYCLEPIGDGADITEEALLQALSSKGIQYGLLPDTISSIIQNKLYYRIFVAARGTAPVKGKDGQIIDLFSRSQELHLKEDERGTIDYKNPGVFQSVQAGQTICTLIQPEEGTEGCDIMGKQLAAEKGKMPPIPKGKNTSVTEDGSALIADTDGDLSFQHGTFRVEPQLIISQDVDNNTGNVNFAGDIVIQGEVKRGFQITAGGKLTVYGLVEGAVLSAGKDIVLSKGMNGSGGGMLTAKGSIYSRFLEQTKACAEGDVVADVMIGCSITAGGNILATSGKGIIIGGTLSARQYVEARRIGNQSEIRTAIKIGVFIQKKENLEEVTKELKSTQETLDKIIKNYNYLNRLPSLSGRHQEIFDTLSEQKTLYENKIAELETELAALQERKIDYSTCHVRGDMIYGITEVSLNSSHITVRDTTARCNVYFSKDKGELVLGTF